MTHKKHEIAVFIENEEMLREARGLIEKYGEKIDEECFNLDDEGYSYLKFFPHSKDWSVGMLTLGEYPVTLTQLEEILKNQ